LFIPDVGAILIHMGINFRLVLSTAIKDQYKLEVMHHASIAECESQHQQINLSQAPSNGKQITEC
jgi:hypothetical protein